MRHSVCACACQRVTLFYYRGEATQTDHEPGTVCTMIIWLIYKLWPIQQVKFKICFPHFVHCSAGIATCHSDCLNVTISVSAPPNPVCTQGVDSKLLGHCRGNASTPCSFILWPCAWGGLPFDMPKGIFWISIFFPWTRTISLAPSLGFNAERKDEGDPVSVRTWCDPRPTVAQL